MRNYQFIEKLTQLPFIDKIVLFGSRARRDNDKKSDIDIAIFCPSATEKDWLKVVDIVEAADTLLKIDCVRFDTLSEDAVIKKNILAEGVVLYEKSNG